MLHTKNVDSRYGAPMGRHTNYHPGDMPDTVTVCRVLMLDGGAYDIGGAYWGIGEPLFEFEYELEDEVCNGFLRAANMADAISKLAWDMFASEPIVFIDPKKEES